MKHRKPFARSQASRRFWAWPLRRRAGRRGLVFDALGAYLGLLIGIVLGSGSFTAASVLPQAVVKLCVAGAVEMGRDGAKECGR